jgi:hypothetical protein
MLVIFPNTKFNSNHFSGSCILHTNRWVDTHTYSEAIRCITTFHYCEQSPQYNQASQAIMALGPLICI